MTANDFSGIFLRDLAPHQDDATTAGECIDHAVRTLRWYVDNEPDCNVVNEEDAAAFLQWIADNREDLLADLCMWFNDTGPTVEAAVALGKSEILQDIADGTVPVTIDCFGDLHDYVDANMYGGLGECEYEWPTEDGFCDYGNAIQDALDAWLKKRAGIVDEARGYDKDHGVHWRVMLVMHPKYRGRGRFQVLVKLQWSAGAPLVLGGVGSRPGEAFDCMSYVLYGYKWGIASMFPKGHKNIDLIEKIVEPAGRAIMARQGSELAA